MYWLVVVAQKGNKMKIWIVREGYYREFCGAFSSEEKAKEYVRNTESGFYEIDCVEVDNDKEFVGR